MTRALALVSGGLDSILAAKLIMEQGIDVIGLCYKSAFFGCEKAVKMAEAINLELKVVDFSDEHLKMLKNPKHGYGKNMNPCIDCHAMMMNYTGKLLEELDADFIITGEVLNQRPMSQTRNSLDVVKKESGYEEYILRPLSAKRLPPTRMELDGLVDRERLLDIDGRSRKVQMEMAKNYGILDYPSPAGGCLLTDPGFSKRLKDIKDHGDFDILDVEILKVGRHLRISERAKVISTRDEGELKLIVPLIKKDDYVLNPNNFNGSTIIVRGNPDENDLRVAGSICGRYSKGRNEDLIEIKFKKHSSDKYDIMKVVPARDEDITSYLL